MRPSQTSSNMTHSSLVHEIHENFDFEQVRFLSINIKILKKY